VAILDLGGFFLVFFCQNEYILERGKSMGAVQTAGHPQDATPPSFESVWAVLQENAQGMKELKSKK